MTRASARRARRGAQHGPSRKKLLHVTLATLGGRIRFERVAAGLTMTELAARMASVPDGTSYTKSFISLLEQDKTQPAVATLALIGRALNVSLDWLVYGERRVGVIRTRSQGELVAAMRAYQSTHRIARRVRQTVVKEVLVVPAPST